MRIELFTVFDTHYPPAQALSAFEVRQAAARLKSADERALEMGNA